MKLFLANLLTAALAISVVNIPTMPISPMLTMGMSADKVHELMVSLDMVQTLSKEQLNWREYRDNFINYGKY